MADAGVGLLAEPRLDSSGGIAQLVEREGDRLSTGSRCALPAWRRTPER